jgi:hypothetical protein
VVPQIRPLKELLNHRIPPRSIQPDIITYPAKTAAQPPKTPAQPGNPFSQRLRNPENPRYRSLGTRLYKMAGQAQHTNYLAQRLHYYQVHDLKDMALWTAFRKDFRNWTEEDFSLCSATLIPKARDVLRHNGVWVVMSRNPYKVLYNTLRETEPTRWIRDELLYYIYKQKCINSDYLMDYLYEKPPPPSLQLKKEPLPVVPLVQYEVFQILQAEAPLLKKPLDNERKLSRISRDDIPKPEPRTESPGHSGQPKSLDDKEKPLGVPKTGNGHENRKAKEEQPGIITISHEIPDALCEMCPPKTAPITANPILTPQTEKGLTTPQDPTTTPEDVTGPTTPKTPITKMENKEDGNEVEYEKGAVTQVITEKTGKITGSDDPAFALPISGAHDPIPKSTDETQPCSPDEHESTKLRDGDDCWSPHGKSPGHSGRVESTCPLSRNLGQEEEQGITNNKHGNNRCSTVERQNLKIVIFYINYCTPCELCLGSTPGTTPGITIEEKPPWLSQKL